MVSERAREARNLLKHRSKARLAGTFETLLFNHIEWVRHINYFAGIPLFTRSLSLSHSVCLSTARTFAQFVFQVSYFLLISQCVVFFVIQVRATQYSLAVMFTIP